MATNRTDLQALRFVIRNGFSHDLADLLLDDGRRLLPRLRTQPARTPEPHDSGLHH